MLWPKMGFERGAVVTEELAPRAIGQDAGWPCWQFTRKGGGYPDYVWKRGALPESTVQTRYGDAAPRSVELISRKGEDNPNDYLLVFNREGAYGHDPGAIDPETGRLFGALWLDVVDEILKTATPLRGQDAVTQDQDLRRRAHERTLDATFVRPLTRP